MGTRIAPALAAALLLSGCMSSGTNVSDAQVDQFVKGKTSRAEVIASLGPPTSRARAANGDETLTYSYMNFSPQAQSFIPLVGGFIAKTNMRSRMVTFKFAPNGVLEDWSSTDNDMSTNNGLLNQK